MRGRSEGRAGREGGGVSVLAGGAVCVAAVVVIDRWIAIFVGMCARMGLLQPLVLAALPLFTILFYPPPHISPSLHSNPPPYLPTNPHNRAP